MSILVTGAAGFIGSHVAKALLARGERVVGVDNFSDYYDPVLKFARLKPLITGEPDDEGYRGVGLELGIGEGAARVAMHRLRRRYRDLLREAIADLVDSPGEIETELRHLIAAVR